MHKSRLKFRMIKAGVFKGIVVVLSFLSIAPLMFIIFYLMKNGLTALTWDFLTELPRPVGEKGGGISSAIAGSFILVVVASLPSIPLGIAGGIYLSEHRGRALAYWGRIAVDVLQGTPSIVVGIIAYIWVVVPMGGFSALSGGIALGIMMLPMIIKATEETLKLIPATLKEASMALGVPYYRTILRVVLPAGLSGIVTGILISIGRIVGETAPLLFTAFGNAFMNWDLFNPVNSLPLLIYNYATSPYPEWHKVAWGASCVLVGFVLAMNLVVRTVIIRWKVRF